MTTRSQTPGGERLTEAVGKCQQALNPSCRWEPAGQKDDSLFLDFLRKNPEIKAQLVFIDVDQPDRLFQPEKQMIRGD